VQSIPPSIGLTDCDNDGDDDDDNDDEFSMTLLYYYNFSARLSASGIHDADPTTWNSLAETSM